MTETEICNLALSHLGTNQITDIDGTDPESVACATMFDPARDEVLSDFQWTFCNTQLVLTEIDETRLGWDFIYSYPQQAVRVWNIYNEATFKDKTNQDFELYFDAAGVKRIASNLDSAYADYSYRVTDTTLWEQKFINALSYKLASMISHTLIGDPSIALKMAQIYEGLIGQAKRLDFQQKIRKPNQESGYINSR
ncbi:MAG: hypothetical protein HC880_00755 [Bacteroidia bacterium]|nr:hypothetical protein [Bacteroidia bacterium]